MNGLSWMLYLMSVVESLHGAVTVLLVVLTSVSVLAVAAAGVAKAAAEDIDDDEGRKFAAAVWRWVPKLVAAAALVWLVHVFLPTERTLYLIAGSELGETAIQSEDGQMIIDAVRKRVREYLGDEVPSP